MGVRAAEKHKSKNFCFFTFIHFNTLIVLKKQAMELESVGKKTPKQQNHYTTHLKLTQYYKSAMIQ